ncbi:MAG: MFS transporter [Alphaproteobacteria bacterium]
MKSLKNIKLFYLFNFLDGFWPCAPFFVIYFSEITGSFTLAMSLGAIHNLTTTCMEAPTGILSDKFQRKTVTFFGSLSVLIAACLYAMAETYELLVLASIFYGIYNALMSGNNDALIYDSLKENGKEKKYHKVLGKSRGFKSLAFGISALVGAGIVWLSGIRETFYVVIAVSVLLIIISLRLHEPKIHTGEISENPFAHFGKSIKNVWKNKRLRYLTLATGLDYGIGMAAYDFVNVFFNRFVPTWVLGALRTFASFLGALGNFLSHKISMSFGYTKTVLGFIGLNYVINIVSVLSNSVLSPFIKSFDNLTYCIAEPAQNTLMQKEFTDKQRATMGSVVSLFRSFVYGICSLLVGVLADIFIDYVYRLFLPFANLLQRTESKIVILL